MSKLTGTLEIKIAEKAVTLFYGYKEITEIMERFGEEAFENTSKRNPLEIVDLIIIGTRKHSPDVTRDFIIDANPPIIEMMQAIDKAYGYSYFGVKRAEEIEKLLKEAREGNDQKKKEASPTT